MGYPERTLLMRNDSYLPFLLVLGLGVLIFRRVRGMVMAGADPTRSSSSRNELEYLKAVNSVGPPKDPQLLFLLMGEYANANQATEGVEFLSARLNEFSPRLSDSQRALYLSTIALLRAQYASSVSLWNRMGYVKDTIAMLDQAKSVSAPRHASPFMRTCFSVRVQPSP